MLLVGLLFLKANLAWGVYLTMTDIELTLPSDRGKFQDSDHPIITLLARDNQQTKVKTKLEHLRFSIKGHGNYFDVFAPSGDVLLKETFFKSDIKGLGRISATACVENTINEENDTTNVQVNIFPLDNLDCDDILQDICYWTNVTYKIEEDTPASVLGSLASPYIKEMCTGYKVSYTTTSNRIKLIPPPPLGKAWSVGTAGPLTYSNEALTEDVICIIEHQAGKENGTTRQISREIKIRVLDIDNNPPIPQYEQIVINMTSKDVRKKTVIEHPHLIFTDEDNMDVNHYEAVVEDEEEEDLLQPICNKHRDTRIGNQTAIHCHLTFNRNKIFKSSNYSFVLQLNDTTMKSSAESSVVKLPVHLVFDIMPAALTKRLILYPERQVIIFRTAAPWARITQPTHLKGATNFTLSYKIAKDAFDITKDEGIIYIRKFIMLRNAPEYISLNISWTRNNRSEFDEVTVRIIQEPNKTCGHIKNELDWTFCSSFDTYNRCLKPTSCALSTGGAPSVARRNTRSAPERCMWRGDKISSNVTHLYSTCTPDTKTCPDGICDSLEELNDLICPQDCTEHVVFPTKPNSKTKKGIDEASGVIICSDTAHCVAVSAKLKKQSKTTKATSTVPPVQVQPNVSSLTGNYTSGKFLGVDMTKCGTICVLGITGGTLFLGSAVALVVICWRLDRVKKAVREKNDEETHEMTAPLSISVARNFTNDPLPLNFQMAALTADMTALNIIKKYSPDPKWEFPRSQLVIEQTLGEGEFGRVLRAKALNISGQTGYTTVAVKTLKDDARESELNDLLSEYQLLKEVSHPNVIRLLGVCTVPGGPVYLIIEYAEYGSLRNYLRRSRHLRSEIMKSSSFVDDNEMDNYDEPNLCKVTSKEILSFAWQICNGMAYLSDIKLVHRDLAARNVLLAADKICKISDFGLTRDVYEDNAYFKRSKGRVPVKWMAPESLADHVYTTKSDVWSFGILIWELVTLGATPYPGIAVQNLFHLLKQGYRMQRPDSCSPGLYKIMRNCWHIEPEHRPTFQALASCWEKLLEDKMEYTDLSNNAIINREYFGDIEEKEENLSDDHPDDISPLNYLSRAQSYEKCGATDKILNNEVENITQNDINLMMNTQGYETPVKVARKVKTPTNEDPQEYTDMGGKSKGPSNVGNGTVLSQSS